MDSMDDKKKIEEDDKMWALKEDEEDEMTKKSKELYRKLLNDLAKNKKEGI